MYILNNWTILHTLAPGDDVGMRLFGEVFGHPDYVAGAEIAVSALSCCRQEGNTITVTTDSGSEYVLGTPHPAEANAVVRVLRHMQLWAAADEMLASGDAATKAAVYVLKDWFILQHARADGEVVIRLRGRVYGNPRYLAGNEVTISALRSCRQEKDSISVITRNGSEYVLGKPNRREPLAKVRLLRHFEANRVATAAARKPETAPT
jgi:hypothetical protein